MIEVVKKSNNQTAEKRIKYKIKLELEKLNFNFSYIGTKYLFEAIYILYTLKLYYNFKLEKDIYPIIATKYSTSSHNIKNNIINATDKMYYDCEEEILESYIDEYIFSKPGPKNIIRAILKRIKDM